MNETSFGRDGISKALIRVNSVFEGIPLWSPCSKDGETLRMFVNERVALGWWGDRTGLLNAWFETGDFEDGFRTEYVLSWKNC